VFILQQNVLQYEHKRNTAMTMTEPQIDPGMAEEVKDHARELRGDQTSEFDLPQQDQAPNPEAPAEMTADDEAGLAKLDAAPEAAEPAPMGRVSDANILDLREKNRAEQEAAAKARLDKLQAAEDSGTLVYTDGQKPTEAVAPTPETATTEAPAGEKKSWLKRLFGQN
jgi:hypothetical protein